MRAIEMVMAERAPEDMVLVTGSVYLIGEIYQYFLAARAEVVFFLKRALKITVAVL